VKEELTDIVRDAHKAEELGTFNGKNVLGIRLGVDSKYKEIAKSNGNIWEDRDFLGVYYITHIKNVAQCITDDLKKREVILHREDPLAVVLQKKELGEDFSWRYSGKGNKIINWIEQSGHLLDILDYEQQLIRIDGDPIERKYDNLLDFLEQLQSSESRRIEIEQERARLEEERRRADEEQRSAQEKKRLTEQINALKEEKLRLEGQIEDMLNLTRYIHRQTQLKFHPIVDPIQSRIKFNNLYNGKTVVIAGGPGTGKTTTMIGRLKYLTALNAIDKDLELEADERQFNLTYAQRNKLEERIQQNKDWMFFSPSQLLRQYLAQAMELEGLSMPSQKTQNWEEFVGKMMKEYGFFTMEENSPFKNSRHNNQDLIYQDSKADKTLLNYYLNRFSMIESRLPDIAHIDVEWKETALYIKNKLHDLIGANLEHTVYILTQIHSNQGDASVNFENRCRELLEKLSNATYARLKLNESVWNQLVELVSKEEEDKPIDSDAEIDVDDEDEAVVEKSNEYSINQKVDQLVRRWLEHYSRSIWDKNKTLTDRQLKIKEIIIPTLLEDDVKRINELGKWVLFKSFSKYARGAKSVMMRGITSIYKSYRRQLYNKKDNGWNLEILNEILSKGNNRLHVQEQALLLGFINNLVRAIQSRTSSILEGKYFDQYNLYARPIIGIDEATDFSEIEIYAMMSFATSDFSSITIAGDVMQRMTTRGLKSWDDLDNVVPNKSVEHLNKSYRQSRNMLAVAQQLCEEMGQIADYTPHLKEKRVPKALAYINSNEGAKITWIEHRIKEVFEAYGKQLPSIAIFLNNKESVQKFAEKLNDTDFFFDNSIPVVDGSQGETLGNKNQVRVFPINAVKGMEFDVVFFHNIDDTDFSDDLVKRYLYVGVSRASFYLGATFNSDNPELSKYFTQNEDWSQI